MTTSMSVTDLVCKERGGFQSRVVRSAAFLAAASRLLASSLRSFFAAYAPSFVLQKSVAFQIWEDPEVGALLHLRCI